MSEVKVNKVSPRSGTTVTIGDSGDTINIVGTLQNNGSPLAGDISSVVAGTGLSGGATSGVATLNIEAAQPTITSLGTITGFTSTGIDDNATSTAITIDSSENVALAGDISTGNSGSLFILDSAGQKSGQITNSSSTSNSLKIEADPDGSGANTYIHFQTDGSEKMRITSAGLVGIGTSAPSTELEVYGTIKAHEKSGLAQASILIDALATGNPHLAFQQAGTYKGYIHYLDASDTICLNDGSGNGLHYSPTLQRLGIGTSSPGRQLQVSSTDPQISLLSTNTSGGSSTVHFGDSDDDNIGQVNYQHGDNSMRLITNASERMRIDSSGRVLIGTTSTFGTNGTNSVINIPLNTTNSTSSPFPNGIIFRKQNFQGNNAVALDVEDFAGNRKGSIQFNESGTSFNTSSDYRLKENVSYDFDATTRLKQLKPARFNFISDADTTVDGFLAHEVSSIVPEAITGEKDAVETYTDDDGNEQTRPVYQGIDQSKLVPLLVKTIQELEARITTLENA